MRLSDHLLYYFIDAGFKPLHEYQNRDVNGTVKGRLSTDAVLRLFAEVLSERFKPFTEDGSSIEVLNSGGFVYTIRTLPHEDWF